MGIDLANIDTVKGSNEGFDVQIYHPGTNEDLGITITVLGKDSDEFQSVTRAQSKKRMARLNKGGFRAATIITPEEIEQDAISLLAACTKKWSGVVVEGNAIECTTANATMLYERFPWIREQVDVAIGDRANFIKA
jgi:hypothetical protein